MPNDIPDWTAQAKVNLVGGVSGVNLGDVGAAALQIDSVTEQISSGPSVSGSAAMASFKPAAGATIAQVGVAGAATLGTASAVTGAFGQVTSAGDLLTAKVTAPGGSSEPTTTATGWVKIVSVKLGGGWTAIWARPNSGASEAAPQFTSNGAGTSLMACQLNEYSGALTASPSDQTGSGSGSSPGFSIANAALDVAFGDLVEFVSRWFANGSGAITFVDTYNNAATAVSDGAVNDSANTRQSNFSHGLIPAAATPQPLGVAVWDYDSVLTSAPATGSAASVVFPATAGKAWRLAMIDASVEQTTATAGGFDVQVLDGATVKFTHMLGITAAIGASNGFSLSGISIKGTVGNSMTVQFAVAVAGAQQRINAGAYQR